MLQKDVFAAVFVTLYLVIYVVLLQFDTTQFYGFRMLIFSPLLLCWMVYTVLKHGKYKGQELGEEEFGYQDKAKSELGVF